MAKDFVCGMDVDEGTARNFEFDGQKYFFCSEHCRTKFASDPVTWIRQGPPAAGGGSCCHREPTLIDLAFPASTNQKTGAGRYICPMCEGVESDGPAACPKCGMALEPAQPALPTTQTVYSCPMHPEVTQDGPGSCPKCGMALEPTTVTSETGDDPELRYMTHRFWLALIMTVPVFALAMLPMLGVDLGLRPEQSLWIQFLLSTPVVVWAGWPFFQRGWRSVMSWNLNMFTLISLGVGAAYLYSSVVMLWPDLVPDSFREHGQPAVYFEAAAVIIVLVLLGQVLELKARRHTNRAIQELISLSPPTARLIKDGTERVVPLADVHVGDLLKIVPGDKIPVDGVITTGRSAVNESMMTGEPQAVVKEVGDSVIGGTVNETGSFQMRASRVGEATVLAQIIQMVASAQRSRAPIQRIADVVAGWFVPAVMLVAVLTFVAWAAYSPYEPRLAYALVNAVSVLIIACPCALGLATPMAIMVGVGRGAKEGVLIKDAAVLEVLGKVDTVVVDKTGTLTEGRPRLRRIVNSGGHDEQELLRLAASVEQNSEHPLGRSIVMAARDQSLELLPVEHFQSITGEGVQGVVDGRQVHVGKRLMFDSLDGSDDDQLATEARQLEAEGCTVLYLGVDGNAVGLLAVSDPVKASTPDAIAELHHLGMSLVMLTGDNPRTAEQVGRSLGIDTIEAGVNPSEKNQHIRSLKSDSHTVAMAGDGINDAPALAAADVGIAMGTGTDVAIESAGVTLLKGDLRGIVKALRLGRATMRNIRQNLFFAFVYNVIGVAIAAGVLVPLLGSKALLNPMIAATAMSFSSVSVIANSLRLRRVEL